MQSNPVSLYLFVLYAENRWEALRRNINIRGLHLWVTGHKESQYTKIEFLAPTLVQYTSFTWRT